MRIALLDDEKTQLQLLEYSLIGGDNAWGEEVECVLFSSGAELLEQVKTEHFDCLIMDRQLPDISGDVILQWVRQYSPVYVQIIMVSNLRSENDIANTIDSGADDYVTKPFRPKELVARVKRLRARQLASRSNPNLSTLTRTYTPDGVNFETIQDITLHDYHFNRANGSVKWPTGEARLTEREFSLALYLFSHVGSPLSRDEIFAMIWKRADASDGRVLTSVMHRIRNLLNLNVGNSLVLRSVYGYGYRLDKQTSV